MSKSSYVFQIVSPVFPTSGTFFNDILLLAGASFASTTGPCAQQLPTASQQADEPRYHDGKASVAQENQGLRLVAKKAKQMAFQTGWFWVALLPQWSTTLDYSHSP